MEATAVGLEDNPWRFLATALEKRGNELGGEERCSAVETAELKDDTVSFSYQR